MDVLLIAVVLRECHWACREDQAPPQLHVNQENQYMHVRSEVIPAAASSTSACTLSATADTAASTTAAFLASYRRRASRF